jgi:hypothetical protein
MIIQGYYKIMRKYLSMDRELWLIAILTFLLFYALGLARPQHIFWSLDEGGKWIYMESVLRNGDPRAPLIYPGQTLDSNLENVALYFFSRQGNEIYSWWSYGFPLLTLPLYQLLGWSGLYLLPALAGSATAFFSGKITKTVCGQSRLAGIAASLLVALTSPVFFYSTTFWEHTLSTAFIMGMAYCLLVQPTTVSRRILFLGGVAGSLAVFFRTEAGLIIFGMGIIFFYWYPKKAFWLIAGGVIMTTFWMVANRYWMGSFLSSNADLARSLSFFPAFTNAGNKLIPYILFNAPVISAFDLGRNLLIGGTLSAGLAFLCGFFPKTRWLSVLFLAFVTALCGYVLLQPEMYRSVHGLILICPLIIVASWVFASPAWKQYTRFWVMLAVGIIVFLVGYILRAWVAAGGLQWGPRYMLAFYPVLIIAVVVGSREMLARKVGISRLVLVSVLVFAIMVGVGFEIRGYITMIATMRLYQQSSIALQNMEEEVIVTDCTWMPMVIPDLYWSGNVFSNPPGKTLLVNMKRAGRASYQFVELQSCNTDFIDDVEKRYQSNPTGLNIRQVNLDE